MSPETLFYFKILFAIIVFVVSYNLYVKEQKRGKTFTWFSTAEEAADNIDLNGKTVIVTGCNSGIGKEIVRVLLKRGAHVIMGCRNLKKANIARNAIIGSLKSKSKSVISEENCDIIQLDTSSLQSVLDFCRNFRAKYNSLHYLINNAGIMDVPNRQLSVDGYELQFATNFLGHFYLSTLLLQLLWQSAQQQKKSNHGNHNSSRIIHTASHAHCFCSNVEQIIDDGIACHDGPNKKFYDHRGKFFFRINYALTKACQILHAQSLRRVHNGVVSVCLHPGTIADTNIISNYPRWIQKVWTLISPVVWFVKTVEQGSATTLRCISLSDEEIVNGGYYESCNLANEQLSHECQPLPVTTRISYGKSLFEKSVQYKLCQWAEGLIQSKGFPLRIERVNT